jgi:hypothetical protein
VRNFDRDSRSATTGIDVVTGHFAVKPLNWKVQSYIDENQPIRSESPNPEDLGCFFSELTD